MTYTTLISPAELAPHLHDPDWVILDCRFALTDPYIGRKKYQEGHLPGAIYADLNQDLSGPIIPGKTGRHPLPEIATFSATLSNWGIDERVQVVAYDDMGGVYAGRLWWMLRWLGHERVAVLDGGVKGWLAQSENGQGVMVTDEGRRAARHFVTQPRQEMVASLAEMEADLGKPGQRLLDARAADRFRGENETIDARAGHIPGAVCAFYGANLGADGRFQSPEFLQERFRTLLGDVPPTETIFYCGSGVSACHNLLAMEIAGLPGGRLYVGSWSEWSADPAHPIATTE